MSNICKKSIVISIILLLVGVSYTSAISIDTESTISYNDTDDCRECNEISDADLIIVERLLNRVEVYSKLLLVLSRHNPELREISVELSSMLSSLKRLDLKDTICDFLFNIGKFFDGMQEWEVERPILKMVIILISISGLSIVGVIWTALDCYAS